MANNNTRDLLCVLGRRIVDRMCAYAVGMRIYPFWHTLWRLVQSALNQQELRSQICWKIEFLKYLYMGKRRCQSAAKGGLATCCKSFDGAAEPLMEILGLATCHRLMIELLHEPHSCPTRLLGRCPFESLEDDVQASVLSWIVSVIASFYGIELAREADPPGRRSP